MVHCVNSQKPLGEKAKYVISSLWCEGNWTLEQIQESYFPREGSYLRTGGPRRGTAENKLSIHGESHINYSPRVLVSSRTHCPISRHPPLNLWKQAAHYGRAKIQGEWTLCGVLVDWVLVYFWHKILDYNISSRAECYFQCLQII